MMRTLRHARRIWATSLAKLLPVGLAGARATERFHIKIWAGARRALAPLGKARD